LTTIPQQHDQHHHKNPGDHARATLGKFKAGLEDCTSSESGEKLIKPDTCDALTLLDELEHAIGHLDEHSERAHIVARCAIGLVKAASPIEVLDSTLKEAVHATRAERGMILMWNEKNGSLEKVGAISMDSDDNMATIDFCDNFAKQAFEECKVIACAIADSENFTCSAPGEIGAQVRSVIAAPLIADTEKGRQTLGVVYIDSRQELHAFVDDDKELIQSFAALAALSLAHLQSLGQIRAAYRETVEALVRALEAKDKYTRGHSERVAEYSRRCGIVMNLPEDRLTMLYSSGLLHDVGKIGVRDSVLFKPGKLTQEEYEHVKLHADMSETIVRGLSYLEEELNILAGSQEHYDGTGYPRGTKADEIPIESYIIQVADAWDAMTSTRVYRTALPIETAISELNKYSGSQFHPKVVDAFLKMIENEGLISSE
jgi:HD-GYP domain-containing protein (c-di-GMP phosphodiesterase class II)